MNANLRREKILTLLRGADAPMSATAIASLFSVSRQIIVGDIALLRAGGEKVLATPRGYILEKNELSSQCERRIVSCHSDDRMGEELYTVVDLGGTVLDVTVEHSVYGEICAPLHMTSRFDVDAFLLKCETSGARPLCDLTGGVHLHTIRCANETVMARIENALREKGFLVDA